jgi:hypothetical protein
MVRCIGSQGPNQIGTREAELTNADADTDRRRGQQAFVFRSRFRRDQNEPPAMS